MNVDVVDRNDQVIRVDHIQTVRYKGLPHRYVRVMVRDQEGRCLLQMRSPKNFIHPNCWDFSAAGHLDPGELYQVAAERELAEEAGLVEVSLQEVEFYQTSETYGSQILNRFNKTFEVTIPSESSIVQNDAEVLELRWFSKADLKKLLEEQVDTVTPALKRFIVNLS